MTSDPLLLALEIEGLLRVHRLHDERDEAVWQQVLQRKGRYKDLTGTIYQSAPDVNSCQRAAVFLLFERLHGFRWRSKRGWCGISGFIAALDAPVPCLEGISTAPSPSDPALSTVTEISLAQYGCKGDIR